MVTKIAKIFLIAMNIIQFLNIYSNLHTHTHTHGVFFEGDALRGAPIVKNVVWFEGYFLEEGH